MRSLLEVAGLRPDEQRAHMMQHWRQYELSAVCCRQNVFVPNKGKAAYVDALLVGALIHFTFLDGQGSVRRRAAGGGALPRAHCQKGSP